MTLFDLVKADPTLLADLIPQLLSSALAIPNLEGMRKITATVQPEEWGVLVPKLVDLGEHHQIYPAHEGLRRVSRAWMDELLLSLEVTGAEHLEQAIEAGPTVLVTNHLSYVDANATDMLIQWALGSAIADRVAYLAGPKVYSDPFRRVSVAAINSLPVPQSSRLGHNDTQLPARELAVRALQTVEASKAHLESGGVLAFYPEGSRSRDGRLCSFFKGTRRYLRSAVRLVPAALVGTDSVMGVSTDRITPATVNLHFAPAVNLETTGAREALAEAFHAIAAQLPPEMKPESGTPPLQ